MVCQTAGSSERLTNTYAFRCKEKELIFFYNHITFPFDGLLTTGVHRSTPQILATARHLHRSTSSSFLFTLAMLLGGSRQITPSSRSLFGLHITSSRFQPRYRTLIYRRSCLALEIPKCSTFMYHPSTCSVHRVCPEAMDLVSRTQFNY
jgi:hypothetical protein